MRLKNIKLSGFKSFVDPTTVDLPTNLVAIVGPNGCGKSNIIDAVRWVMGESSVKNLRGESMSDVIFSGSSNRKPVSRASIELVFDNRDGGLGGEYAAYAEIAVRREVVRDGQSNYYLNGARCRRRDITDIFLGTGLGPRSYAIIQQGTVSRLIEAKPEEMRVYLEEAAGISKYKERRKETENRIKHTRENLDRLSDLREELDKQLSHLQRQAEAAERYQVLKQEEQLLSVQLNAIRWRDLDKQYQQKHEQIRNNEVQLASLDAKQQNIDTEVDKEREAQVEHNDALNQIQDQFYAAGADISRLEQDIQHRRERCQQLESDLQQTQRAWQDAQEISLSDEALQEEIATKLEALMPQTDLLEEKAETAQETLLQAEETLDAWQSRWDDFNQQASETTQNAQVEQTRIQHLEQHIQNLSERIKRFNDELAQLAWDDLNVEVAQHEAQLDEYTQLKETAAERLQQINSQLSDSRDANQLIVSTLNEKRSQLQNLQGQKSSLETLQQAALGKNDKALNQWLEQQQLSQKPRLAEQLHVSSGWEQAVETVLTNYVQAICVDDVTAATKELEQLQTGTVNLFNTQGSLNASAETDSLASKVQAKNGLPSFLYAVYVAEDLTQALARAQQLQPHESIVTRDGIWLGKNWLRVQRGDDPKAGVIKREQTIKALNEQIQQLKATIEQLGCDLEQGEQRLDDLNSEKEESHQQQADITTQIAELQSQLRVKQDRIAQLSRRQYQLSKELHELKQQLSNDEENLKNSRVTWQTAMEKMEHDADQRETLLVDRDSYRDRVAEIRQQAQDAKRNADELNVQLQTLQTRKDSLLQNLQRAQKQVTELAQRKQTLQENFELTKAPIEDLQIDLEAALSERLLIEDKLTVARKHVDELSETLRQLEQDRHQVQQQNMQLRNQLEQQRMVWQELKVKRQTLDEQIVASNFVLTEVLAALEEHSDAKEWEQQLERVVRKVQRLGPINLAAIDECKAQSERKTYLDAQDADLVEALETLENAINKIDRETRARFKITFDRVNKSFSELFPKLFGGGSAYLDLTEDDLLNAGVSVMARPPGKRNSSIQILSGGEKALTAVALVFAIFQLNPAPFCMLDEVDAPLDDANIGRFSNLVKEMSEKIQFIFISHNKPTMEIAKQLIGITMHEPGVSRVVAVDVDEAVDLAAV